jgi:single-strand DNA-binding protein
MASFNKVVLVGNLTRDPEVRYTTTSMAVCDIGLAVNDRRKNANGEWVEETTFVDITLWGRTAEVAGEYLKKGSSVLIEGRLKLDSWEKDGQKRTKLKVVGETMQMLGGRGEGGGGSGGGPRGGSRAQSPRNDSSRGDSSRSDSSHHDDYGGDEVSTGSRPATGGGDEIPF